MNAEQKAQAIAVIEEASKLLSHVFFNWGPRGPEGPGCAIGHLAWSIGERGSESISEVVRSAFGLTKGHLVKLQQINDRAPASTRKDAVLAYLRSLEVSE